MTPLDWFLVVWRAWAAVWFLLASYFASDGRWETSASWALAAVAALVIASTPHGRTR